MLINVLIIKEINYEKFYSMSLFKKKTKKIEKESKSEKEKKKS